MSNPNRYLVVILSLAFVGCNPIERKSEMDKSTQKVIYVSNYPLYYFVSEMAPSSVSVMFSASEAPDPAHWNPKTDSIVSMQKADLIIINGASYEKWLINVSLAESKVINTTSTLQDRLIVLEEGLTHSHGPEGAHEHLGNAITTWMDLNLALEQAGIIHMALVNLIPEEQTYLDSQFNQLQSQLSQLHSEFIEILHNSPKQVAFSHPVYQYFQRAYQITGPSLHWEPDEELTSNQLKEFEHLRSVYNIEVLIWEAEPLRSAVETLEELGVQSLVVNPMGNTPKKGDFLSGLKRNLEELRKLNSGHSVQSGD